MHGFETFQQDRKKDIDSIARATRGEMDPDELLSEAFLLALDIEGKTHQILDLTNSAHQELLLRWLNAKFVRFADKKMRTAARLDDGWDDESEELSAGARLASVLTAPETENPLTRQVMHEDQHDQLAAVQASYSEASAYTLLLIEWGWDFKGLAADLLLGSTKTLRNRVARAAEKKMWQPSLFDGVDQIDPRFRPARSRGTKRAMNKLRQWFAAWRWSSPAAT